MGGDGAIEPRPKSMAQLTCRAASTKDLQHVALLHLEAFPGFFLSRLGRGFLLEYYRTVLEYERGIILVASEGPYLYGVVAGFVSPAKFSTLLKKRGLRFAVAALPALFRQPSLLVGIVRNWIRVTRTRANDKTDDSRLVELASLAVRPSAQGLGIGQLMVDCFLTEARSRGADRVRLTTDANDNERVNAFYGKLGFRHLGREERRGGRVMNVYVKELRH